MSRAACDVLYTVGRRPAGHTDSVYNGIIIRLSLRARHVFPQQLGAVMAAASGHQRRSKFHDDSGGVDDVAWKFIVVADRAGRKAARAVRAGVETDCTAAWRMHLHRHTVVHCIEITALTAAHSGEHNRCTPYTTLPGLSGVLISYL